MALPGTTEWPYLRRTPSGKLKRLCKYIPLIPSFFQSPSWLFLYSSFFRRDCGAKFRYISQITSCFFSIFSCSPIVLIPTPFLQVIPRQLPFVRGKFLFPFQDRLALPSSTHFCALYFRLSNSVLLTPCARPVSQSFFLFFRTASLFVRPKPRLFPLTDPRRPVGAFSKFAFPQNDHPVSSFTDLPSPPPTLSLFPRFHCISFRPPPTPLKKKSPSFLHSVFNIVKAKNPIPRETA